VRTVLVEDFLGVLPAGRAAIKIDDLSVARGDEARDAGRRAERS
jgi:hypothetical protein